MASWGENFVMANVKHKEIFPGAGSCIPVSIGIVLGAGFVLLADLLLPDNVSTKGNAAPCRCMLVCKLKLVIIFLCFLICYISLHPYVVLFQHLQHKLLSSL